jgi:hypothetical protein
MKRFALAVLASAACFAAQDSGAGGDTEYIPDDPPAGNCGEPGEEPCETSGIAPAGDCQASSECDAGLACSATFDGDIGRFECQASCIEDFDEARWCADDASCCGPGSICQGRGYCVPAGATSTGVVDDTGTESSAGGGGDTTTGGETTTTNATTTTDAGTTDGSTSSGGSTTGAIPR